MNDVIVKEKIIIENLIYEIRGVQVILDSDLARLYECVNGTKDINKAVKIKWINLKCLIKKPYGFLNTIASPIFLSYNLSIQ